MGRSWFCLVVGGVFVVNLYLYLLLAKVVVYFDVLLGA